MLTIRFARVGKKNKPQFKIMLQEHTIAPGGTHVEVLGSYDPRLKQAVLKEERIKYWVSQGVKVSDTAYNLFLKQGILTGEKRKVKIPARKAEPSEADGPAKKVEEVAAETPAEAKPDEAKVETAKAPKTETAAPAAETKKPARSASPSDARPQDSSSVSDVAGEEEKAEEKKAEAKAE